MMVLRSGWTPSVETVKARNGEAGKGSTGKTKPATGMPSCRPRDHFDIDNDVSMCLDGLEGIDAF